MCPLIKNIGILNLLVTDAAARATLTSLPEYPVHIDDREKT